MFKRELIIKNTVIYILLFFLIGCSPVYIKIGPEYKHDTFKGRKVGVIVYNDSISISYRGDVENEFGKGDTKELIKKYFYTEFPECLQEFSVFSEVYIDSCPEQNDFNGIVMVRANPRDQKEVKIFMPDSGTVISLHRGTPDYVLILQDIRITSVPSASIILYGFVPVAAVPYKPVTYVSEYVLWDNNKRKMAGWGKCESSISTGVAATLETWNLATGLFARHVLSDERLKNPALESIDIGPVEESLSNTESIVGCWHKSESKMTEPVAIKSRDNKQMFMNINGKTRTLNLDTTNTKKKDLRQLTYHDTYSEVYYGNHVRVKLHKFLKSLCKDSNSNPKMVRFTGEIHITYAGKEEVLFIRGTDICEE
jgi:hypothetical protein